MGQGNSHSQDNSPPSPPPATPAVDTVVEVDQAAGMRGAAVVCRYTCTRTLEQDYELEERILGTGMSGPVRLAAGRGDGRKCAVKSFCKTGLSQSNRADLKSEAEIYLGLDHPHVARLEMVYETDRELHLVMEYMSGGELYDRLESQRQYTEEAAADATYQMLLAVGYLHANQIAHRDLKLENFLYERPDSDHLKIIDFGFAKFWDDSTKMSQACGSLHYVAPEVLRKSYTEKADLWSLGVIAWMLLTGGPPFHGSDDAVLRKIKNRNLHYSSRFERLSSDAKDFLLSLLVLSPKKRLSAQSALEHPWIAGRHSNLRETPIDVGILRSLRSFAHASGFRRNLLSMMAWSLSTENLAELRSQFLLMDKEKKGTIKHKDLASVMMESFSIDAQEAQALCRSMDTDQNDEIEYSEFLAAALVGHVKVHEDVLRQTFSRFDADGNGRIDRDELHAILGQGFDECDVKELLDEADTSGDGEVDYDEFIAYFYKAETESEGPLRTDKRRKQMEQLGSVIDGMLDRAPTVKRSVTSALGGSDDRQGSAGRPWLLRSQTAPLDPLPTLLRSPAPAVMKMKTGILSPGQEQPAFGVAAA